MADIADKAAELEQIQRDEALERTRGPFNGYAQQLVFVRCRDCSVGIPLARLRAVPGTKRCADCQEVFDMVELAKRRNG